MSSGSAIRFFAFTVGSLLGLAALLGLSVAGLRTQLWFPISAAAAALSWVLFAPWRRKIGLLDVNAAQMCAATWVCALPGALLVVPWVMREGAAQSGLLPLALTALGAALVGGATAAALSGWSRGPSAFPFPSGQAVAEVIEAPRRGRLPRAALLSGTALGAWAALSCGGLWPPQARDSWGELRVLNLGQALGADASIRVDLLCSAAALALGIFVGARGLLLAAAAFLAGTVWAPHALERGWIRFPSDAPAWLAPLALGLLGGAAVLAVLGGLRGAGWDTVRRGVSWSVLAALALAAFAASAYFTPVVEPLTAYRAGRVLPEAYFQLEERDRSGAFTAAVVEGPLERRSLGDHVPRRGAEPILLDLADGVRAELTLYPSEVADPSLPLELGRHFRVNPPALREPGRFLLFAPRIARIYEEEELVLSAWERVASVDGKSLRPGWNALPAGPGIAEGAGLFLLGREPIDAEPLRFLAKPWTCIVGLELPAGVRAELLRTEGVPLDQPARVRDDAGVQLRLFHERDGRTTELARLDVGKGVPFWTPFAVPANAAAGTPEFHVICGPNSVPPGKSSQPTASVFRRWEQHRFLPLGAGRIGGEPGALLGLFRERPIRASRHDRPLEGLVVELPEKRWGSAAPTRVALELPNGRVRAGEALEGVSAFAACPRELEFGVRLVEVQEGSTWRDAFEIVLRPSDAGATAGAEVATALVDVAEATNVPLRWRGTDGREHQALLQRSRGKLFPGRYPSGRADEARLAFLVPGIRCVALEDGDLASNTPPRLRVEQLLAPSARAELGRVRIEADGSWRALSASGGLMVHAADRRFEPRFLVPGAYLSAGELQVLEPAAGALRNLHERRGLGPELAPGVCTNDRGQQVELPAAIPEGELYSVAPGVFVAGTTAETTTAAAPSLAGALRSALLALAVAALAAVASLLMAGVGELLPWTVLGAVAAAGLHQLGATALAGPLAAFAGVVAASHAADLGRDLRTGGIVGAPAASQIRLRLILGLVAPAVVVLAVGWIAWNHPYLHSPRAFDFEALTRRMSDLPELYFSTPRLAAGALAGGAAALVGFPGLGVLAGLGLLLPQGLALTLGLGALLRVVADRFFAGGDVRSWLLPFAAGLLLGEVGGALGAAAWLELSRLGV
ncbi:MAG: hypothetical protein JNM84_19870 [Planctomycetes bacterium]|nr:hypothetical protein [Planctomycetota bacterium]